MFFAMRKPLITFLRPPAVARKTALNNEVTPAIGIAYLSGYLQAQGYRTAVVDPVGEDLDQIWPIEDHPEYVAQGLRFEEILEKIPKDTDLFGFSVMFSGEWPITKKLINLIKERFPNVPTLGGGEHITALPEFSLQSAKGLDYCAIGEGEQTLLEFCDALFKNGNPKTVPNIVTLDENGKATQIDKPPRIKDIDSIPWPDWNNTPLKPFWDHEKSHGISSVRDMPMMASRGCPFQCTFCSNPAMWTTRYVTRNVDDLLNEIQHYIKRFDITSIQFYDLTAIVKKSWIVEFCKKYIERGLTIRWTLPSGTRSEALDDETLSLMSKTNCRYLVYAPESGCPESLQKIKKRVSLPKITDSMRTARRHGITVRANLIIGFPHEKRKNVWRTLRYGIKLICLGIDEVTCFLFSPYPGSELYKYLSEKKSFQLNDHYFYELASLNGDVVNMHPSTYCEHVSGRELAIYRLIYYLTCIALSYLIFPWRILRFFFSLTKKESKTVVEHRLKGLVRGIVAKFRPHKPHIQIPSTKL